MRSEYICINNYYTGKIVSCVYSMLRDVRVYLSWGQKPFNNIKLRCFSRKLVARVYLS
jgi:hypothetical protein